VDVRRRVVVDETFFHHTHAKRAMQNAPDLALVETNMAKRVTTLPTLFTHRDTNLEFCRLPAGDFLLLSFARFPNIVTQVVVV